MLFGQLAQSASDAGAKELALGELSAAGTGKGARADEDDEAGEDELNDALTLLAALGTPTTSHADVSLPGGVAPADIAKAAVHAAFGNADPTSDPKRDWLRNRAIHPERNQLPCSKNQLPRSKNQ